MTNKRTLPTHGRLPKTSPKPMDHVRYAADLAQRICPHCHVALLYPHPEYPTAVKCHGCGFMRHQP